MLYLQADSKVIPQFDNCGKFFSRKEFRHQVRRINSFDMIFGCSDNLYIYQNQTKYVVGPENYILLIPGFEHGGYEYTPPGMHCYWMHFILPQDSYHVYDHKPEENGNDFTIMPEYGCIVSGGKFIQFFHQLMDMSLINDAYRQRICGSLISLMLMQLTREFIDTQDAQNQSISKMHNIKQWIRVHATDDISLEEIARTFGYNPQYLSHKFKQSTGETMVSYINRMRTEKAKSLLNTTQLTIDEIGMRCGFSNSKYFMRLFKKMEDLTPSEYRFAFIKENINRE